MIKSLYGQGGQEIDRIVCHPQSEIDASTRAMYIAIALFVIAASLCVVTFLAMIDAKNLLKREQLLTEQYRLENVVLNRRPVACKPCGPMDWKMIAHASASSYTRGIVCGGE